MATFDRILPEVSEILEDFRTELASIDWLLINRDLNGRVRIIAPAVASDGEARRTLDGIAEKLKRRIGPRAYSVENAVLYEDDYEAACEGASLSPLKGFENITIADRLPTAGDWASIAPEASGAPLVVFFSVKGGVGRSTALAASALSLAQNDKKVLVLDLDLASPGLSSALLPEDRRPKYGIVDWLVEDLVGDGDAVFDEIFATSELSRDGEIFVVPAHGRDPGEYISKLGRAWMSVIGSDGKREGWPKRLRRLIDGLKKALLPDIVLIDARAGIDDLSSTCVTDLGAKLVLLFALDDDQTWSGYRILFRHWRLASVAEEIRERLQLVGAMTPETERDEYLEKMREASYELFAGELYDAIPPGEPIEDRWNFEESDEAAPHTPWPIRRNQGFAALRSLRGRLAEIDESEIVLIFGPLIEELRALVEEQNADE